MMRRTVTVIDAATSFALVSLDHVKDELGISAGDVSKDAQLKRYIDQCSSLVHTYCQRIFPKQTYRNTFSRDGAWCWFAGAGKPLSLSVRPVISVASISEDNAALSSSDYSIDTDLGSVWRLNNASPGMWLGATTVVVFDAGYNEIPGDVVEATLYLITLRFRAQGRDPMLKVKEGPTFGREEFWIGPTPMMQGGMPINVAQMLDPYRQMVIA